MLCIRMLIVLLCQWTISAKEFFDQHASDRIVGGNNVSINRHPYMVSFGHDTIGHLCGGTILKNRWILTAAHCIIPFQENEIPIEEFYVKVGAAKLSEGGALHRLENWIPHESYNSVLLTNDIGLLKLKTAITFNSNSKTVNLPYLTYYCIKDKIASIFAPWVKFTAVGWGTTESGQLSDNLKEVHLPFIAPADCRKIWNQYYTNQQICTVQQGKGICGGDSGGPLMYNNVQLGITSFGATRCATLVPDAYTRVCKYIAWIARNSR